MNKIKYWKKAMACALALAFLLTACGGTAKNSNRSEAAYDASGSSMAYNGEPDYAGESYEEDVEDYDEMIMEEPAEMEASEEAYAMAESGSGSDAGGDEDGQADLKSSNRKIVYTGNISLQTLEYDNSSQSIHGKINSYGGFIENEDTYNEDPYWYYTNRTGASAKRTRRNLNITARIPAEKFDAFMKDLENDGQVTNTSVNARNISVQYATHDATRKALEIEQKRLLEMMEKAETVEDMITVEKRLTQVERELNDEKTELSAMDRDVGFSTVYISLQEVFEYSEQVVEVSYGEKLKKAFGRAIDGFVTFWQDLILFIVETFPFLIMLGILIALFVRFLRRRHRRKMERMAQMQQMGMNGAVNGTAGGAAPRRGIFRRRKAPPAGGSESVPAGTPGSGANGTQEPGANGTQEPGASGTQEPGASGTQEPGASGTPESEVNGAQDPE